MDSNNKENIEPIKYPKVRVQELNMNASDEESEKGEWAVIVYDSEGSTTSSKHDTSEKNDESDPEEETNDSENENENENEKENNHSNIDLVNSDDSDIVVCDEIQSNNNIKSFIDLKDLHKFGIKIDQIEFVEDSSDIDIIEEEKSSELLSPGSDARSEMSVSLSSVVSQYSSMSAIREHFFDQIPPQELSKLNSLLNGHDSEETKSDSSSNQTSKVRAYVHKRNAVLNGKLTLILVLSITAVIGLGLGHFIGWSHHWTYSHRLSMAQVIKLKQLQDDLLVCMRIQNEADFETNGFQRNIPFKQVCQRDSDYWKNRFETFFQENKGMMELFQRTQKRFHDSKESPVDEQFEYVTERECVNKTTSEAFNKLELNFLVRQMEHLNMLEVLEQVKKSEKQVKHLREENEDLKKKLEEEEQDDEVIVQEWNHKVTRLQQQNQELAKSIVDDEEEDRKVIAV